MTLHGAGEAFTFAGAYYVHELAGYEVGSAEVCAGFQQGVFRYAEFGHFRFGLQFRFGKLAALRFFYVLYAAGAYANLNGGVAVTVFGAGAYDLRVFYMQQRYREHHTLGVVYARHAFFLCD